MVPIGQSYPSLICLKYNCRQKDLECVLNSYLNLFLSQKFAKLTFPNLSEAGVIKAHRFLFNSSPIAI